MNIRFLGTGEYGRCMKRQTLGALKCYRQALTR